MSESIPKLLIEIREQMKSKLGKEKLKSLIAEVLCVKSSDLKYFNHNMNGHRWSGYIYQGRNSKMGTVVSYFDNTPVIVRGYPKIKYVEDRRDFLDKECICEEKLDGTNLGFFMLPNNTLMCKTRLVERGDVHGYKGRVWMNLFKDTGFYDNMVKICEDDYIVFGELYGNRNQGEFIKYSIPIDYKVFDIVDIRTMRFVDRITREKLCNQYGLKCVDILWKGTIKRDNILYVRHLSSKYVHEDGSEGFVAKIYTEDDALFGKIKPDEIKELCYKKSTLTVPNPFIQKAIKKALDQYETFKDNDEMISFIEDELLEEFDKDTVHRSIDKIKRLLWKTMQQKQSNEELKTKIHEYIKEIGLEVTVENKGVVMRELAKKFKGVKPSLLYYLVYGDIK